MWRNILLNVKTKSNDATVVEKLDDSKTAICFVLQQKNKAIIDIRLWPRDSMDILRCDVHA